VRSEDEVRSWRREPRGQKSKAKRQEPKAKTGMTNEIERSRERKETQELGRCTMGRRKTPRPEHWSPHELRRLWIGPLQGLERAPLRRQERVLL